MLEFINIEGTDGRNYIFFTSHIVFIDYNAVGAVLHFNYTQFDYFQTRYTAEEIINFLQTGTAKKDALQE